MLFTSIGGTVCSVSHEGNQFDADEKGVFDIGQESLTPSLLDHLAANGVFPKPEGKPSGKGKGGGAPAPTPTDDPDPSGGDDTEKDAATATDSSQGEPQADGEK